MINPNKIKGAAIWSFIETIGSVILGLLTILFLARLLSPEDYGQIATSQIISALIQILLGLGLSETLIQKKNLTAKDIQTFWSFSIVLSLLASILCIFIGFTFYFFEKKIVAYILYIESLTIIFTISLTIPSALLYKSLEIKKIAFRNLIARISFFIIAIPLALLDCGIWSFVIGNLIQNATLFLLIFFATRSLLPTRLHIDKNILLSSLSFSFYIMLENLLWSILSRVLGLLIALFHGVNALGLYNMASKLTDTILSILNMSITRLTLPIFSSVQDDRKLLLQAFQKSTLYFNIIAMPAFFTMALTAKYWVNLLFGDKWSEMIPIIQIISVMYGIMYSRIFVGNVIKSIGKSKEFLYLSLTAATITILAVVLTQNMSLTETLLALSIPRIIVTIPLGIYLMYKICNFSILDQIKPLLAPIIITFIICTFSFLFQSYISEKNWMIFISLITIKIVMFISIIILFIKTNILSFKSEK